jgi:hypothetical protein
LEKARKAKRNKQSSNSSNLLNLEITLFESVSKKEVWEFINKFSIFVTSGIDIK